MLLRYTIAGAISGYQRHISPHKGYCCAHRVLYGGLSCSEYGRRTVLRYGVVRFLLLQARRFTRCAGAYAALQTRRKETEKEYTDFPWKSCLKSKKADDAAACCCLWPW